MSHQSDLIEKDILAYLAQHEHKDMLRFLTCGSVDDGKSTLIGRLLHDSKLIYEDQLAAVRQDSRRFGTTGGEMDLALLVDGLQAEREQGITIDVAYRYFSTAKRKFIIADTPGHEQYTRNMATGASTCDLAIILIDARHGVVTQTKRHSFIVSLLGIKHVVVAVNKMDLVGYSEQAFEKIREDYADFSARLDLADVEFVPISALHGDNVVHPSASMPWYTGATLMHILENVHIASDRNFADFRFPVQLVLRPNLNFRGFSGTIASGVVRKGDSVMALPSRRTSRIKSIVTLDGELDEAFAGMAVTLTLEDEIDIPRGDLIVHPDNLAPMDERFEAMIVWMAEEPMNPGKPYLIKHATQIVPGRIERLSYKVNVNTMQHEPAEQLQLNEIAHGVVELSRPLPFDPYRKNRQMGAFVLIDRMTNNTVGAGMILDKVTAARVEDVQRMVQESLQKYEQRNPRLVTIEERLARQKHKPVTVLFTGLVGSGRLVIAYGVERKLFDRGLSVQIIDNRTSRLGQTAALDFASQESSTGLRRAAEVSRLFNEMGLMTICSFVAPRADDRSMVKAIVGPDRYLEVFLSVSMDVARRRDKAGLYQRADLGHIKDFPGVSLPYETPSQPDLVLDTANQTVDQCVDQVIALLERRGVIPSP